MNDKKNFNFLKIISLVSVILYSSYYYFTRSYIANIKDYLISDMHLTASQFSKISAAFSFGYSISQILGGYMLEKISFRYLSSGLLLLASLTGYVFVSYNDPVIAEYTRYVLGVCFSIASIGAYKYISVVWRDQFSILANALSILMNLAAAIAASGTVNTMLATYGWRNFIKVYLVFGVVLAVILYLVLKVMTDKEKENQLQSQQGEIVGFKESIVNIVKVPTITYAAIYAMTICAASYVLMDGAGNTLLKAKFPTLDPIYFSWPAMLNTVGAAFGSLFNIFIGSKKMKTKYQMLIHAILCMIAVFVLVFANPCFYTFVTCCFVIGFTASGCAISFVWLEHNLKHKYHGTGFGLLNFVTMFFGSAVVQSLAGTILDWVKQSRLKTGVQFYEGYTYLDILGMFKYLLVGITILALLSSFFVKDDVRE